jgi:acetyl esterase/lipase
MSTLEIIVIVIASLNLLLAYFVIFSLNQPASVAMWMLKVVVCGLSSVLFLTGILIAIAGSLLNFMPAMFLGFLSALPYLIYMFRVSRPPEISEGFANAFGSAWMDSLTPEVKLSMLPSRYVFLLPKTRKPLCRQNISYYKIPGTDRNLVCDIWEPFDDNTRSGLAFIYLHGSAWTCLDKDIGTRPFFRHLTSQGHLVMDVAYRLFPETNFMGMIHDVKHAIAWMKANASMYGVNPEKIVVGGGSAGAHLALLAAYTDSNKMFTPDDLVGSDTSVCGVVSLYGQSNLTATYYHTCQHLTSQSALRQNRNKKPGSKPSFIQKIMGADFHRLGFDKDVEPGMLIPILGGDPYHVPNVYAQYSPDKYVHKNCPPTLLIHGEHDILAPLHAIRELYDGLERVGVQVVLHTIPQTDHAFDLVLPKISIPAHNAIYDVERFLAVLAVNDNKENQKKIFAFNRQ